MNGAYTAVITASSGVTRHERRFQRRYERYGRTTVRFADCDEDAGSELFALAAERVCGTPAVLTASKMSPGVIWRSALFGGVGGGGDRFDGGGGGAAGVYTIGAGNGQLVSKSSSALFRLHRLPTSLRAFVCNFLWPLLCLALRTGATGGVKAVHLGGMEKNGQVKVHVKKEK
ncbi:hypothetical protein HPB50_024766 [Hyalomma asiaticum]|uniref:Uncharacterized protein n=1 Tax=Hyalomma asiaticum TaxID=266040 RepID=A0ACB7T1T3_HYAAI|nr:hypothetical protein HPB50_024766 [Hyalomma asiaticum]